MLSTLLLDIENLRAQGRGSFRHTGLHLPLLARWTQNTAPFKFVRARVRNDEHQEVAAFGAFKRLHHVPLATGVTPFTTLLTLQAMHVV
jgi:hypothetical protein